MSMEGRCWIVVYCAVLVAALTAWWLVFAARMAHADDVADQPPPYLVQQHGGPVVRPTHTPADLRDSTVGVCGALECR